MTSVKISGLPQATTFDGGETFPVVQGGVTKVAGVGQVSAYAGGTGNFLLTANNLSDLADKEAATSNLRFLQAGTGAVARTVRSKLRDVASAKDFGAVGDDSTDNATAIQAGIDAAAVLGLDLVFPAGIYRVGTVITLKPNVRLIGWGDAQIKWTGGATTMFATSTSTILYEAGFVDLDVDAATATPVFDLNSPYSCQFSNVRIDTNSATSVVFDIGVNTSGGTNPDGNRNAVFSYFSNILQEGTCGTFFKFTGDGPTGGPANAVITLNTFIHLNARGCNVRGIDFVSWTDSNYFSGITRIQLNANSAVGVEFNTGAPTGNVGVYANNFDHLAIDTFGTMTGRIACKMNLTKFNKIGVLFNDPVAEGGDLVIHETNTVCVDVVLQKGGTNDLYRYTKGFYERGSTEIMTASAPFRLHQTWSNAGATFNAWEVDVTDTNSSGSSTLASLKVGGVSKVNVFKSGGINTVGDLQVGQGATGIASIEIGTGRTVDHYSFLDFIGDTTFTDFGLRVVREPTANGGSQLLHRGAGALLLAAQDAGSVSVSVNGTTRASWDNSGATFSAINFAADAQASDTYVITLSPALAAYTTGLEINFKANTANTGAATLNVNGLGAKTIVKSVSTTLANNDILANMICKVVYDGTNFVLMNPRVL